MSRRSPVLFVLAGVLAFAAACSPLGLLNTLPADPARVSARGVAYGADPRQRLDVYTPASPAAGKGAPVLVFFYGGGWSSGDRSGYAFAGRSMAAEGFVTVVPDYRLVPQVRFPAFVQDGAAAVAWARAHAAEYGGDPDRIVLMGHSAGAYIAAMLAMDTQWLAAAGAPPRTVKAWAGLAGPYDFLPFDVKSSQDAFGSFPDPAATQPITFAGAGDPPAFLGHGDADATVKLKNSRNLAAKLEAAGVPVELKVYPGVNHVPILLALTRTFRGKATVRADAVAFLKAHDGG